MGPWPCFGFWALRAGRGARAGHSSPRAGIGVGIVCIKEKHLGSHGRQRFLCSFQSTDWRPGLACAPDLGGHCRGREFLTQLCRKPRRCQKPEVVRGTAAVHRSQTLGLSHTGGSACAGKKIFPRGCGEFPLGCPDSSKLSVVVCLKLPCSLFSSISLL